MLAASIVRKSDIWISQLSTHSYQIKKLSVPITETLEEALSGDLPDWALSSSASCKSQSWHLFCFFFFLSMYIPLLLDNDNTLLCVTDTFERSSKQWFHVPVRLSPGSRAPRDAASPVPGRRRRISPMWYIWPLFISLCVLRRWLYCCTKRLQAGVPIEMEIPKRLFDYRMLMFFTRSSALGS